MSSLRSSERHCLHFTHCAPTLAQARGEPAALTPDQQAIVNQIGQSSDNVLTFEAFFVVHHACATITTSIAHEIGHILGARHDRFVDARNVPFAYGHGYVNGNKWRDMMHYKEGCGGCPIMGRQTIFLLVAAVGRSPQGTSDATRLTDLESWTVCG